MQDADLSEQQCMTRTTPRGLLPGKSPLCSDTKAQAHLPKLDEDADKGAGQDNEAGVVVQQVQEDDHLWASKWWQQNR
jgi:hypothetical protein